MDSAPVDQPVVDNSAHAQTQITPNGDAPSALPPQEPQEPQEPAVANQEPPNEDLDMQTDEPAPPTSAADLDEAKIRTNALYLFGVNDLSTKDVEIYMSRLYNKPFQMEWIDDESLNIVYDDPEDAFQSLVAMTDPSEFHGESILPEQLRKARVYEKKADVELKVRFARTNDKKQRGSRVRSRYYLLHGEPTVNDYLVRFGTKRSKAPMLYGTNGVEIVEKRKHRPQGEDLFPEKAQKVNLDDIDDDLFPLKAKARGPTKSQRRRRDRRKRRQPDLFANKVTKQGQSDSGVKKANDAPNNSVYQQMDY